AQAGHRDAQLSRAKKGIQVRDNLPGDPGAAMPFCNKCIQLGVADFYQGKFGSDEKSIHRYQAEQQQDLENTLDDVAGVHECSAISKTNLAKNELEHVLEAENTCFAAVATKHDCQSLTGP